MNISPQSNPSKRFVQLLASAPEVAVDRLKAVNAPDPMASLGLLIQLVAAAKWQEPGRGTLSMTKSGLAEFFGVSWWSVNRHLESLESASLVRCECIRGHDGEVMVLAYDELVRVSQLRPPRNAPRYTPMATAPTAEVTAPTAERPAETLPRNKTEDSLDHRKEKSTKSDELAARLLRRPPPDVDQLKQRVIAIYTPWGADPDSCIRIVDQMRCYGDHGIADSVIEEAIGLAAERGQKEPDTRTLVYLFGTARGQFKRASGQ